MPLKLFIVNKQPKEGERISRMPNKAPVNWKKDLALLRGMWEAGEETSLQTAYQDPFKKLEKEFNEQVAQL